jgi:ABC-type antimicrobial peptide transport system permease subunit
VQDQTYLESLNKLKSSLELLRLLLPLLAVLGTVISFLATYAMTRGRQKEFAVMRCLGLRQRTIFSMVLLEQLILILMGGSIGMCFGLLMGASIQTARICGVLLLYMLGTATAAMSITRINVMQLMKTED